MRLKKVRVQKYRSIRDSGWFDVEQIKTILVGPNEAGKTALLEAIQQLNAPEGVPGFDPLRDYPRSELNDLDSGRVDPGKITVVEAHFGLEDEDCSSVRAIDPGFGECEYVFGRRLDNSSWHRLEGGPNLASYADIEKDLARMASYADRQRRLRKEQEEHDDSSEPEPSNRLTQITSETNAGTTISGTIASKLRSWLKDDVLPMVAEDNKTEENRYDRLMQVANIAVRRDAVVKRLRSSLPVFVYFNNYFRVHPRIHLRHLADRVEQNLLDDAQYDFGNLCLLKLLGFTARELSELGAVKEPAPGDVDALDEYQAQLDHRKYKLNAASVKLTSHIREVWNPDATKAEADKVRIEADQQYLKVVVEDDLGVEIELDQRSEGFRWLVSFYVVFFAEAADKYENAVLLLDEPGLSLHGLKQREFRETVSKLGANNQLLYTTHSPFLVGPDELDLVRVIEMIKRDEGTKVSIGRINGLSPRAKRLVRSVLLVGQAVRRARPRGPDPENASCGCS